MWIRVFVGGNKTSPREEQREDSCTHNEVPNPVEQHALCPFPLAEERRDTPQEERTVAHDHPSHNLDIGCREADSHDRHEMEEHRKKHPHSPLHNPLARCDSCVYTQHESRHGDEEVWDLVTHDPKQQLHDGTGNTRTTTHSSTSPRRSCTQSCRCTRRGCRAERSGLDRRCERREGDREGRAAEKRGSRELLWRSDTASREEEEGKRRRKQERCSSAGDP